MTPLDTRCRTLGRSDLDDRAWERNRRRPSHHLRTPPAAPPPMPAIPATPATCGGGAAVFLEHLDVFGNLSRSACRPLINLGDHLDRHNLYLRRGRRRRRWRGWGRCGEHRGHGCPGQGLGIQEAGSGSSTARIAPLKMNVPIIQYLDLVLIWPPDSIKESSNMCRLSIVKKS